MKNINEKIRKAFSKKVKRLLYVDVTRVYPPRYESLFFMRMARNNNPEALFRREAEEEVVRAMRTKGV